MGPRVREDDVAAVAEFTGASLHCLRSTTINQRRTREGGYP